MIAKIANYIKHEIANEPLEDLGEQEDLLGSGIIDSMGMIRLVSYLEQEFQVTISSEDMIVENFMTLEHILKFLSEKKGEQ